eukprot:TRINITY_DN41044_c0_g1_i1.p1 TRINITY_DN41044_c0_g1~~TRINITY_DN41044_c0_g1_i1.p1  ORF type:complete len:354 (-),score=29.87 TRINITY_DN41044_c0_g1_i1:75-1136(-)
MTRLHGRFPRLCRYGTPGKSLSLLCMSMSAVLGDEKLHTRICPEARPSCRAVAGGICLQRYADVLSPQLFLELRRTFAKRIGNASWISRGAAPQDVFEDVAVAVAVALGLRQDHYASIEYWTKSGFPGKDNFHFDSESNHDGCAMFPYVSAILYLDDLGPPTVIFSKTLADDNFADPSSGLASNTSYLSWPAPNHLLMFSGDALHGVHLHEGSEAASQGPGAVALRALLILNFWHHSVHSARGTEDASWSATGSSTPQSVPLVVRPVPEDEERWSARCRDCLDPGFEFTYRLPGGRTSTHGCTLDQLTWLRRCPEGSDLLLVAVPGSFDVYVEGSNSTGDLPTSRSSTPAPEL